MSLSRRRLLRVAGTGAAVGLAGCSGTAKTPAPGVQAKASVFLGRTRPKKKGAKGNIYVGVVWTVNRDATYLTVAIENTASGKRAETALCGVGAQVNFVGATGKAKPQGPVGSPPHCQEGTPSGVTFGPGDTVHVTVTAHLPGGKTAEITSRDITIPTPTPTPTPTGAGNSTSSG